MNVEKEVRERAATTQHKKELLRVYAESALGTSVQKACRAAGVKSAQFHRWMQDKDFAAKLRDIQETRCRINLDHFEPFMAAIDKKLAFKALEGDIQAIRTVHELLGNLKTGTNVRVDQRVGEAANVSTVDDVRGLVERRNNLAELVRIYRERPEPAPGDPGPAGSSDHAGGAAA